MEKSTGLEKPLAEEKIQKLPKEVWGIVFSFLDFNTLQKVATLVCKKWYEMIRNSPFLSQNLSHIWNGREDSVTLHTINQIIKNWPMLKHLEIVPLAHMVSLNMCTTSYVMSALDLSEHLILTEIFLTRYDCGQNLFIVSAGFRVSDQAVTTLYVSPKFDGVDTLLNARNVLFEPILSQEIQKIENGFDLLKQKFPAVEKLRLHIFSRIVDFESGFSTNFLDFVDRFTKCNLATGIRREKLELELVLSYLTITVKDYEVLIDKVQKLDIELITTVVSIKGIFFFHVYKFGDYRSFIQFDFDEERFGGENGDPEPVDHDEVLLDMVAICDIVRRKLISPLNCLSIYNAQFFCNDRKVFDILNVKYVEFDKNFRTPQWTK